MKFPSIVLAACALACQAAAAEPVWFSDAAPRTESSAKHRHEHGGVVEEGSDGKLYKRLWLRSGADFRQAEYLHGAPEEARNLYLMDTAGKAAELPLDAAGHDGLAFSLEEEGFYDVYLVTRRMEGGVLSTSVAKAEVLKHSCRDGRHDWAAVAERIPAHTLPQAPFEIVRERLPGEDFHTELRSGDQVSYLVLHGGKPAAGAAVRWVTQQGWAKTVTTDAQGRATFQVIRDYFPEWDRFERRHREKFLVVADYTVAEDGTWEGRPYRSARYQATLPGSYLPAKQDYASYLYGLGIGLFAFTFAGLGVYLYRRRRLKPYREVPLDE